MKNFNILLYNLNKNIPLIWLDTPEPWGLFFQDNATPQIEGLEELHNNIMYYLAILSFAVSWILVGIIINFRNKKVVHIQHLNKSRLVNSVQTIAPALLLVLIAFPSFKLLYLMDEVIDPSLVIRGEGHQWYWSYQYCGFTDNPCFSDNLSDNPDLVGEIPSSSRGPYTGDNAGTNNSSRANDYSVKATVYRRFLTDIDINMNSYPWSTVYTDPIRVFEPHLNYNTDPPRYFDFHVNSGSFFESSCHYEGHCGPNGNSSLWKAIEEKSETVKYFRERYNPESTTRKLEDMRATSSLFTTRQAVSVDLAWKEADPHGYNLIKHVRELRGMESGLRYAEPNYISRISRFSFES